MAKGDNERNRNDIKVAQGTNRDQESTFQNQIQGQMNKDSVAGDSERSYLTDNLRNFAATGGIDPAAKEALLATGSSGGSGGGSGGGGGSNGTSGSPFASLQTPEYNTEYAGYQNLADTGGVDVSKATGTYSDLQGPNAIDTTDINKAQAGLQGFAATGGVTSQDMDALNRPLYYEFEKTGGYSDPQLADIRARSNASVPSFYNNLQDQLDLRRKTQGYAPGFDAANRSLMRTSAQQSAEQGRNTELDLADRVRTGRMDAAKQLSSNELGLLNITTPAKEQALAASGGLAVNTQDLVTKVKLAAAQGDVEAQKLIQSGKIAGLGGMTGTKAQAFNDALQRTSGLQQYQLTEDQIAAMRAASSGALGLGYANLNAENQRFLMGTSSANSQAGYGDLLNLYKSAPGALTQDEQFMLDSMGQEGNVQQGLINSGISNASVPGKYGSAFNNVMGGLGAISGGLAGFSGLGGKSILPGEMDPYITLGQTGGYIPGLS